MNKFSFVAMGFLGVICYLFLLFFVYPYLGIYLFIQSIQELALMFGDNKDHFLLAFMPMLTFGVICAAGIYILTVDLYEKLSTLYTVNSLKYT